MNLQLCVMITSVSHLVLISSFSALCFSIELIGIVQPIVCSLNWMCVCACKGIGRNEILKNWVNNGWFSSLTVSIYLNAVGSHTVQSQLFWVWKYSLFPLDGISIYCIKYAALHINQHKAAESETTSQNASILQFAFKLFLLQNIL